MENILDTIQFSNDFWIILLPIILMALDVFTGYINAVIKREVSSRKMREGLGHKVAELIYIIVGYFISIVFNVPQIEYFISIYIIVMELISIMENAEKLGVKTPNVIKSKLENAKDELENEKK